MGHPPQYAAPCVCLSVCPMQVFKNPLSRLKWVIYLQNLIPKLSRSHWGTYTINFKILAAILDFQPSWIFFKWPYFSHFESDWCKILNLSLVCLKNLYYQLWNIVGHLGFWLPSWIFLKWLYLSHFESDLCKILNLNLRHLLVDHTFISDIGDSAPPTSHLRDFL